MSRVLGALLLVVALAACDTNTAVLDDISLTQLSTTAGYLGDPDAADPSSTSVDNEVAFPSTNKDNFANGWAHAVFTEAHVGSLAFNLVSSRTFWSCFEYRADGADPVLEVHRFNDDIDDGEHSWSCVANTTSRVTMSATEYVDVRLSHNLLDPEERGERFDWTRFYVLSETMDVCKDGGWQGLGFSNQGLCIAHYQASENSKH